MSADLFDFPQHSLPLQLRRAEQLRADSFGQSLVAGFAAPLSRPVSSAPERSAATERLLFARRRNLTGKPA